jgi:enamine deaminase RidA (YjgF/YER057c/UK114 family)
MAKTFALPTRQIHLDFHTGPWINDVGHDFDARAFARTMKRANVNSVTVFAKCHHGHLYYNTKHPARHPGLRRGHDMLAEQVDALHAEGIRAPIYISIQCDEYAADTQPGWLALDPQGKQVSPGPLTAGWQILDMSSPYQEYLAEQTKEILKKFKPVDGVFFDMCWDQPSCSVWAIEGMLRRNLNPEKEEDRAAYAREVAMAYMKRFYQMVKASSPNATVHFNSRPLNNLDTEAKFLTQVEIEALPTGGWGYMYFPTRVRFARNFGRPYLGMTARFHKSWSDFGGLKPYPALEYETSQMMAHGAACSIGDQLHPRGVLDPAAYERIGRVYKRVADREPWLVGAKPVVEIGLFQVPSTSYLLSGGTDEGATRILTQLKHQFDVVNENSNLDRYRLLILPDSIPVTETLNRKLSQYVKRGGAVLVSGTTGLDETQTRKTLDILPIKPEGLSPFQTSYVRFGREIGQDVPATDHVMYDRSTRVTPAGGGRAVARVVEPYFDRSWRHFCGHCQTPPDKISRYAAAVVKGRVAYVAYPVFSSISNHGNLAARMLVKNLLDMLLPDALLQIDAPSGLEATVMRQPGRTIVHLLFYTPERRATNMDLVEDIIPLFSVPMSLSLPRRPKKVYVAPAQKSLEFGYDGGRVSVVVPEIRGHEMIVFE